MDYKIDSNIFNDLGTACFSSDSAKCLPISIRMVHAKDGAKCCSSDCRYDIGSLGKDAHAVYALLDGITDGCTAVHSIETVRNMTGWGDCRIAEALQELGRNGFLIAYEDMGASSERKPYGLGATNEAECYLFLAEPACGIPFLDDYFEFCAETWGDDI